MLHCRETFENEIQLAEDECCIIFDFGCYFPYRNYKDLTFEFTLGMERFNDCKLNHRYPNKYYRTISRRYGRKVSKIGYSYIMKLNEQSPALLCLNIGIKNEYMTLIFPFQTKMTKDKSFCVLEFKYMFDESKFYFMSEKKKNEHCYRHMWESHPSYHNANDDNRILLTAPCRVTDSKSLIYKDIIEPCASSLHELGL